MAKNKVISGDFKNCTVKIDGADVAFYNDTAFNYSHKKTINKFNVAEYEVINEDTRKSAKSAVGRALVGGVLLGGVGLLAGLSAKSKSTYVIAIQFKSGEKSLIEVDDKIYKRIVSSCF